MKSAIRRFLVKNFVLDYSFTLFNVTIKAVRASRIIYPIFIITGFFSVTNENWPTPTPFVWFLYLLTATSLFFGFVYFRIYPAKWDELDKSQKYQYGFFMQDKMSVQEFEEWKRICDEISSENGKV